MREKFSIHLSKSKLILNSLEVYDINARELVFIEDDGALSKNNLGDVQSIRIKDLYHLDVIKSSTEREINRNTVVIDNGILKSNVTIYLKLSDLSLTYSKRKIQHTVENGWTVYTTYTSKDNDVSIEYKSYLYFKDDRNDRLRDLSLKFYDILDNTITIHDDNELSLKYINKLKELKTEYHILHNTLVKYIEDIELIPNLNKVVKCDLNKNI